MPALFTQDLYARALHFAATAHAGQTVPGSDVPYLFHVTLVAMEVIAALPHHPDFDADLAVQCALLHDTVEDTATTPDELAQRFGAKVAQGVAALSKDPTAAADVADPAQRKRVMMADSLDRILDAPREVWAVKLADRITNMARPPAHWSAGKRRRYQAEARLILETLGEASAFLAARLAARIEAYDAWLDG